MYDVRTGCHPNDGQEWTPGTAAMMATEPQVKCEPNLRQKWGQQREDLVDATEVSIE